jgi:hypothetical protein
VLRARSRSTLLSEFSVSFSGPYNRTAANHLHARTIIDIDKPHAAYEKVINLTDLEYGYAVRGYG